MNNQMFPQIVLRDGEWLYCVGTAELKLPSHPTMNKIWEASAAILECVTSDCGGNLDVCVKNLRDASKAFAGLAKICANSANDIELELLYAPDENEPWYQR